MNKKFFFAAVALVALASCSTDEFIGENTNSPDSPNSGAIVFGLGVNGATRADMYGSAAAEMLGNNFYVTGTKGTEAETSPSPTLVFDNYLVHYEANTAGTKESNTANWEYVGVTPGTAPTANYDKLSSLKSQTIKYWDYSADQYDFLAFSVGKGFKAKKDKTNPEADEIGVTTMKYGAALAGSTTAYTFYIPSKDALSNTYISDITKVAKSGFGKEVTLKFKNLGSKVRIALYETVPGYSVKDVIFYTVDGTTDFTDANKNTTAKLISASGIPTSGTIDVYFPHVGTVNRDATPKPADYNIAAANVSVATGSTTEKSPSFGSLDNFATTYEDDLTTGDFIGRTLPDATFAGDAAAAYYQTVFPVSTSEPLTLRVDYTLVSTDGSGETINIYGAKAVVPSTYTKWLPNYAYTYIFKISDNTNGWTSPDAKTDNTDPGLFPITFDAVVAEATNATGEQTTITTVATPSITTYQQNHKKAYPNEYSITTAKDIYVQVMQDGSLVNTLSNTNSLLYAVSDADATEAEVMDALEKRTTDLAASNVEGRNNITLTKNTNIDATITSIVNGADNNPIEVTTGQAAKIAITASGFTAGTYAFVYDYTSGTKTTVEEYQPIAVTGTTVGETGKTYYTVTTSDLATLAATSTNITTEGAAVDNSCVYFSVTKNGTSTTTYSYVSVAGKTTLPAGLLKVAKSTITTTVSGGSTATAGTFYFDKYISNNGKYAVKVIRIVD